MLILRAEICQKRISKPLKMLKWHFWTYVKSERLKNSEIYSLFKNFVKVTFSLIRLLNMYPVDLTKYFLVRVKFSIFHTKVLTVWKIQDSSVTQILREIKFGDCKVKIYHFAILEALNFNFWYISALDNYTNV